MLVRVASVPVLRGFQRVTYWLLLLGWAAANTLFWPWWLRADHILTPWMFVGFTLAFSYDIVLLPTVYLYFIGRMRRPKPLPAPPGSRVAIITLCVPDSESMDVIEEELQAIARVRYPHDSWILDEGDEPAVRAMAARLGVRYFTRRGRPEYNQPGPPFQAKTKAGNVNAWLAEHRGDYEFFVQFDIDHKPNPDYLDRVLGYFADTGVAWVQPPSVYGNMDNWVARGAAEQELVLQGPLQMGFYGQSEMPYIIGSHTAYRMSAVAEIGGFQPTRAEDHLDTLVLAGHGYRGVFVPDVLAIGRGPETFDTYLLQHFAWATSLMEVMLFHTRHWLRRLTARQILQFLFSQSWYPLWSTSIIVMFSIPPLALLTLERPTNVTLVSFFFHWFPLALVSSAIWLWTTQWQVPSDVRLSWRGVVLHVARWPIVWWALVNVLLRVRHSYMITRKGNGKAVSGFTFANQWIYLLGVWTTLLTVWVYLTQDVIHLGLLPDVPVARSEAQGYAVLALWGGSFLLLVYAVNVLSDLRSLRRLGVRWLRRIGSRFIPVAVLVGSVGAFAITSNEVLQRLDESLDLALPGEHLLPSIVGLQPGPLAAQPPVVTGADGADVGLPPEDGFSPVAAWPAPRVKPPAPALPAPLDWTRAPSAPLELPSDRLALGAFDPNGALGGLGLAVSHHYVLQSDALSVPPILDAAAGRQTVLLTVQPAPEQQQQPVLEDILNGTQDEDVRRLARVIAAAKPQVTLIRWGHEMEMSGLYAWAANDPELYRAAFRHVVGLFHEEGATNVRWVWSPAGNSGAEAYYPSADAVDYVGLTILGDAVWDRALLNQPAQTFAQLLKPKYDLVRRFGKPVIVAEMGVSGTSERQQEWLLQAAQDVRQFPLVRALVYYDDVNVPNPIMLTRPDWRVAPDILGQVKSALG